MHANFDQFSDIIQHKKIQQTYYIQSINAVCIIAQDWTIKSIDPKNIFIFYKRLNYKTKLTNSTHFMVFCTNFDLTTIFKPTTKDYNQNSKKQEEKEKSIRKVHEIPQLWKFYEPPQQYMFDADSNVFTYEFIEIQVIIDGARINKIMKEPRYFGKCSSIDRSPSYLNIVKNNNWEIRKHFAILHHALKNHFAKNKKIKSNKAGQVLSNQRLIRCISQYV